MKSLHFFLENIINSKFINNWIQMTIWIWNFHFNVRKTNHIETWKNFL